MRAFSKISTVPVLLGGMLSAGCLQKDVTHTIYVSPSGVVWSVLEKDVRSDERLPASRYTEERDYILATSAGRHPAAVALRRLGSSSITTTWLRRARPYSVMTEGQFAGLGELASAILREARLQGDASLTREGCRSTLTVRVDSEPAPQEADDELAGLVEDLERYRLVLTDGRFVSADGFTISADGAAAMPDPEKAPVDGMLRLTLAWESADCSAG
jgi:hypothetical protein